MASVEAGGGVGRLASLGVLVVLMGMFGALYSQVGSLLATRDTGGAEQVLFDASSGQGLEQAFGGAAGEGGGGGGGGVDADALVASLQALEAKTAPVKEQLAGEQPELFATPSPPSTAARDEVRRRIDAGDCAGAADAAMQAAPMSSNPGALYDDVWGCFDADARRLAAIDDPAAGDLAALQPSLDGIEARIGAFSSSSSGGLGSFLEDLFGVAAVTESLASDLGIEVSLAQAAAGTDGAGDFLRARLDVVSGALSGSIGTRLAERMPGAHDQLLSGLGSALSSSGLPDDVQAAYLDGLTLGMEDLTPPEPVDEEPTEAPDDEASEGADDTDAPAEEPPVDEGAVDDTPEVPPADEEPVAEATSDGGSADPEILDDAGTSSAEATADAADDLLPEECVDSDVPLTP